MKSSTVSNLLRRKVAAAPKKTAPPKPSDDMDFVPIGVNGLLASTEKLLAINRGLEDPDERDSYVFKRIWGPEDHLAERIKLDAGKVRRSIMYNAARHKTLKGLYPFALDPYVKGMMIGDPGNPNPLSAPLEEINPMHLKEQARRITQMGPGGIGSDDAITQAAQGVHASQFGFVCSLSGPESARAGVDARLAHNVRIGTDGKLYQQFKNVRTGTLDWKSPDSLEGSTVAFPE